MSEFVYETDLSDRDDPRYWSERTRPLGHYVLGRLGIKTGRETHFIHGPGNRRLAVQLSGHPDGETIYLLHGSPGSRDDQAIDAPYLYQNKLQVVSPDRPGYGFSDRHIERSPWDTVAVVRCIAEYLKKPPRFVIGRSGGGPHALACAAGLPEVERAVAMVSLAPRQSLGVSWYDGMTPFNVEVFEAAEHNPDVAMGMLNDAAIQILEHNHGKHDPEAAWNAYRMIRASRSQVEGLRFGPNGWIDDDLGVVRDWGFDPRRIPASVSTLIWGASEDIYTPLQHSRWLADNVPGAELYIEPDAVHGRAAQVLPEAIGWCLTGEYRPYN